MKRIDGGNRFLVTSEFDERTTYKTTREICEYPSEWADGMR